MDSMILKVRVQEGLLFVTLLDERGTEIEKSEGQSLVHLNRAEIHKTLAEERNPSEKIPKIGLSLGELLLPQPIRNAWMARSQKKFRTILDLDAESATVPWELASAQGRLFLNRNFPFFRQAPAKKPFPVCPWPVELVVVLGSSQEDLEKIGGLEELEKIRAILRPRNRTIRLRVIPPGHDRTEIVRVLRESRPHILHFIGHGDGKGLSLFTKGGNASWTLDAVRTDLNAAEFVPPLIYLNACRSLGGGQVHPEQFSDLADAFLSCGARAVIAMHADISGPRAAGCAKTFYEEVSKGAPIDVALAAARAAVDQGTPENEPGRKERCEAYLPVLLVSGSPDDVLPGLNDLQAAPPQARINESHLQKIVKEMVNHDESRWSTLKSLAENAPQYNVLLVRGELGSGKSWLLGWCIDGWLRRKFNVRYIPMAAPDHWLTVLRSILEGNPVLGAVGQPLPKALRRFNNALASIPPARKTVRGKRRLVPNPKLFDAQRDPLATAFHSALQEELNGTPLVLVLDQFSSGGGQGLDRVTFWSLWESWIRPLVINGDGKIRLILGVSTTEYEHYRLRECGLCEITTTSFSSEHYRELIEELLQARYPDDFAAYRERITEELSKIPQRPPVSPKELSRHCDTILEWAKILGLGREPK
jgi:hypothetical protein